MPPAGVIVSGASTGIGEATVALLARRGYIAFAGVRNDTDAARLKSVHANIRPVLFDVTDEPAIEAAMRTVKESGVPLAGIVSNAGIALAGPLEHVTTERLRRQFDVNVLGAMAFVRLALPILQPQGRVIFIGSISGRLAMPYLGPYSASKFALRALSDSLRLELAPAGIEVSLIEPGAVKTPIWQKGRASRDRIAELLGTQARPHYYKALEAMALRTEASEESGISAEVVAEAIFHALTAPKPRARYLLGSAKPASLIALLPARLRDRLLTGAGRRKRA